MTDYGAPELPDHMNGRIYDPLLGRFLSPDTVIQFPENLQSYNRYSYVRNNPISRVDPDGNMETVLRQHHVKGLEDASAKINGFVNQTVARVLTAVKSGEMKASDAPRAAFKDLTGFLSQKMGGNDTNVATFVQGLGPKYFVQPDLKGSVYDGGLPATPRGIEHMTRLAKEQVDSLHTPGFLQDSAVKVVLDHLAPVDSAGQRRWGDQILTGGVNIGGNAVSTDKLDHMFFQGFKLAGMSEEAALEASRAAEQGDHGTEMTGVFAPADIQANMFGRQFYLDLYEAAKNGTEFVFDINKYNTSLLDEGQNKNTNTPEVQAIIDKNEEEQRRNQK